LARKQGCHSTGFVIERLSPFESTKDEEISRETKYFLIARFAGLLLGIRDDGLQRFL
jgi:hypothetical protein